MGFCSFSQGKNVFIPLATQAQILSSKRVIKLVYLLFMKVLKLFKYIVYILTWPILGVKVVKLLKINDVMLFLTQFLHFLLSDLDCLPGLVGGTNSKDLIRRMLSTAMTNGHWAGKRDKRCPESKKPFKNTALQACISGELPPLQATS